MYEEWMVAFTLLSLPPSLGYGILFSVLHICYFLF